jgi:4-methyl-5(b-hydroxyethyl)-thiazole monophosphate biosynthesis
MVALPGGMPGSQRLAEHPVVQRLLREVAAAGRYTAAVCAAPIALAAAGLHAGRTVTSFPGLQEKLAGATYVESRVVIDGPVVTSRGAGTALEFSLALVGLLAGSEAQERLRQRMLAASPEPARVVGSP